MTNIIFAIMLATLSSYASARGGGGHGGPLAWIFAPFVIWFVLKVYWDMIKHIITSVFQAFKDNIKQI